MIVLSFLVILAIVLSAGADTSNNNSVNVYLNPNEDNLTCYFNQSKKIIFGEKFNIKVYNDIVNGSCSISGNKAYISSFTSKQNGVFVSEHEVDADVKSKMNCSFLILCDQQNKNDNCSLIEDKSYGLVNCSMQLDVRNPYDMHTFVCVNGNNITALKPELENNIDFISSYKFYDGEPANIRCLNTMRGVLYARMSAHRTVGNIEYSYILPRQKKTKILNMFVKLTAEYQNGYINCDIASSETNKQSLYTQIKLEKNFESKYVFDRYSYGNCERDRNKDSPKFEVNGVAFKQPFNQYGDLNFEYEYYDGENLTIKINGDLICENYTNNTIFLTKNNYNESTTVICMASHDNIRHGRKVSLKLKPQTFLKDFRLAGLSMGNTLAKLYYNDSFITIYYEFDEQVQLECTSKGSSNFSSSPEIDANIENKDYNNRTYYYKLRTISLKENKTIGDITFQYDVSFIKVYFTRTKLNNVTIEVPGNQSLLRAIIGISAVIILIVAAFLAWMVKRRLNSKKSNYRRDTTTSRKVLVENPYAVPVDNMINDNTEYAVPYVPETIEELYSEAIPKHKRIPNEPEYEEAGYATVGQNQQLIYADLTIQNQAPTPSRQNQAIYAEAVKKCDRLRTKMNNDSPYAEIVHPDLEMIAMENPYAEPTSFESPYAEPASLESPYAEPASVKSPYAEPASLESPHAEPASVENPYAEPASLERPYAEPASMRIPYVEPASVENPYAEPASLESPYANTTHKKS